MIYCLSVCEPSYLENIKFNFLSLLILSMMQENTSIMMIYLLTSDTGRVLLLPSSLLATCNGIEIKSKSQNSLHPSNMCSMQYLSNMLSIAHLLIVDDCPLFGSSISAVRPLLPASRSRSRSHRFSRSQTSCCRHRSRFSRSRCCSYRSPQLPCSCHHRLSCRPVAVSHFASITVKQGSHVQLNPTKGRQLTSSVTCWCQDI